MNDSPEKGRLKTHLEALMDAALSAVAPDGAVLRHLALDGTRLCLLDDEGKEPVWTTDLANRRKVCVYGAGKGAAPMALALENLLKDRVDDGLVIVKYDHGLPEGELKKVRVLEAAHPVPDEAGFVAANRLVDEASLLQQDDLALLVFTGGASALTPALREGMDLASLQELTSLLLSCGATIHEINTLRKHLSRLSGGSLARAVFPAEGLGLIVSDVVGDDLDVIASGPTVPDSSTFADCQAIVEKYALLPRLPKAVAHVLELGLAGRAPETPKAGDPAFGRVKNALVATNRQALRAARLKAEELGYEVGLVTDRMEGEARDEAKKLVEAALAAQRERGSKGKPLCLLAGGETTVTIKGSGLGGRNQEMALAASLALQDAENIACLFLGTDGTDGPTDAAGGFAFADDAKAWEKAGIDAHAALLANDSYHLLEETGTLCRTGPTRTNVMDVAMVLVS